MDEIKTKVCSKCGIEQPLKSFGKRSSSKDGHGPECKGCVSSRSKKYYAKNRDKIKKYTKKYYIENIETITEYHKKYHADNSDKRNKQHKKWYGENKDRVAEWSKEYYEENTEKIAEYNRNYQTKNREKIAEQSKKYYSENRDKLSAAAKKYRELNKESIADHNKKWREENGSKIKIYKEENKESIARTRKKYNAENKGRFWEATKVRIETDVQFKLARNLRIRLCNSLQKGNKNGSAVRDLGCSVEFLKQHLEAQFSVGMTWENWSNGLGNWNIDHIMPLAAFDLTNRQHVFLACHYGNLQPLWFEDNMRKLDRIPTPENYKTIHEYSKKAA